MTALTPEARARVEAAIKNLKALLAHLKALLAHLDELESAARPTNSALAVMDIDAMTLDQHRQCGCGSPLHAEYISRAVAAALEPK